MTLHKPENAILKKSIKFYYQVRLVEELTMLEDKNV